MDNLSDLISALENKFSFLIQRIEELETKNQQLLQTISQHQHQHQVTKQQAQALQQQCESLKLANSLLGSEQYKRETKLKINSLVRDIDHCISQLSQ